MHNLSSERKRNLLGITLYVSMFVFYIVAFWGTIKSWYMYDDMINYTAEGYLINHNVSVFELTQSIMESWYKQTGRCFFFSSYTYVLFCIIKNVYLYKLLIVITTFIDGVLLSILLKKITASKKVQFLALLFFPVFISLDCRYFNAMYGFHMLLQMCMCVCLIALLAFERYLHTSKIIWQIISCLFLSIALGMYEVSYVLCVLFLILGYIQTKSVSKTVYKLLPQVVTGVLWLIWNVVARLQASSEYAGTKINLGFQCVQAFLQQLSGSCSLISIFTKSDVLTKENIKLAVGNNGVRYILLAICMFIMLIYIWKYKEKIENYKWCGLLGILMAIGPAMLIAMSERYQKEIDWGMGYLPAYISCWGIVVCITLLVAKYGNGRGISPIVVGIPFVLLMVLNLMIADITVEQYNKGNSDQFVAEAVGAGILDEVREDNILVDGCGNWAEADSHYAFLTQRKVNAISWYSLMKTNENGEVSAEESDMLNQKEWYYAGFQKDKFFVVAKCNGYDIWTGDMGNICRAFMADSFEIYIPYDIDAEKIMYINQEGEPEAVSVGECEVRHKTSHGAIYSCNLDESINADALSIQ